MTTSPELSIATQKLGNDMDCVKRGSPDYWSMGVTWSVFRVVPS